MPLRCRDPELDPSTVGWIWQPHADTWHIWSHATPGYQWSDDCADAATTAIRTWIASVESA